MDNNNNNDVDDNGDNVLGTRVYPFATLVLASQSFHLDTHRAKNKLMITRNDIELENVSIPVYLGVTLDQTLSFRCNID